MIRQQWAGLIALFLVLTGGSAYALGDSNTVFSDDIVNGEVKQADVGPGAVTVGKLAADSVNSTKVANNSLSGADILNGSVGGADLGANSVASSKVLNESLTGSDLNESTLGQVPSAALGGIGRWTSPAAECNPESASFFTCAFTTLDLPASTRVLLIGVVKAQEEAGTDGGTGQCLLATQFADITSSTSGFTVGGIDQEHVPLLAIDSFVGPGSVDFAVRCNDLDGDTRYFDTAIAAVALSPG